MKAFSILLINLFILQLACAQVTFKNFDKEAKSFWNEGFRPVHDFDPSLLDQLARASDMSKTQDKNGDFLFTLTSAKSNEFNDLKKAEIAAYIRAMEEFLAISQKNQVNNNSINNQSIVDSPYGKSLTENTSYIEEGKKYETVSSITEFTYQMLLKSHTYIDENQNKELEFNMVQRGFPLFGMERVVNIYRTTDNGKYEVICYLAIDNYWLKNQSLRFTGDD